MLQGGNQRSESGGGPQPLLVVHRLRADPVDVDSRWPAAGCVGGRWHGCVRPEPAAATLEIRFWGGFGRGRAGQFADTSEIAVEGRFFTLSGERCAAHTVLVGAASPRTRPAAFPAASARHVRAMRRDGPASRLCPITLPLDEAASAASGGAPRYARRREHQSFDTPHGVISLGVHRKRLADVCLREHAATDYRSQQSPARDDGSDGRLAAGSVPSRYVA